MVENINMRSPLSYQMTKNDSAPIALINALSLLYEREELDSLVIEGIYALSFSLLRKNGSVEHISSFLEREMKEKGLKVGYLSSHEVFLGPGCSLYRTLLNGGIAVAKIFEGDDSRDITITTLTNDYLYFFDPLYGSKLPEGVEDIEDMPFLANRKIKMSILSEIGSIHMKDRKPEEKEIVLFERIRQ